jgi:hypothetical protein
MIYESKHFTDKILLNSPTFNLQTVADFKMVLEKLLKNKLLMANIFAGVFYILGAAGYMTYPVKYLETQFQQSAARSNVIAGNMVQSFHITVD